MTPLPPLDIPRKYNAAVHFVDPHVREERASKVAFITIEVARPTEDYGYMLRDSRARVWS